ncbi:MAG: hypothetical protein ACLTK0_11180 [Anaerovoracaceae bacterium]
MDTAGNFVLYAVAHVAVLYATLALTKPPRIFLKEEDMIITHLARVLKRQKQ